MSTILTPRIRSLPRGISRRNGVLMAVGGGVAIVAVTVVLVSAGGAPAPVTRAAPPTASTSVDFSVSEQAAVYAALASGDSRLERIAVEVAAGRAGVSALADPRVLHNHGVDTSTRPAARFRSRAAADRFHHR